MPRGFLWFIINHGAAISVKVVSDKRRSPLIQGGLEIPVKVIVTMPFSRTNKQMLDKYKSLVDSHYEEPLYGIFRDDTASILLDLGKFEF